jgi:hypothetical protein
MEETQTPETVKNSLSRRELLKALAAGGSALAAAAFLPDKWSSPEIQAGVLPAHAQATLCPQVFIKDVERVINNGIDLSAGNGAPVIWAVYVNWSPSWDTPPVGILVQFCDQPVTILNVTYNEDPPPYYSARIEFTYTGEVMCEPPIPVRVVVTFSRTCRSEDTYLWEPPVLE